MQGFLSGYHGNESYSCSRRKWAIAHMPPNIRAPPKIAIGTLESMNPFARAQKPTPKRARPTTLPSNPAASSLSTESPLVDLVSQGLGQLFHGCVDVALGALAELHRGVLDFRLHLEANQDRALLF